MMTEWFERVFMAWAVIILVCGLFLGAGIFWAGSCAYEQLKTQSTDCREIVC